MEIEIKKNVLIIYFNTDEEIYENPLSKGSELIDIITLRNLPNIKFDFSRTSYVPPNFAAFFPLLNKLLKTKYRISPSVTFIKPPSQFISALQKISDTTKRWRIKK